MRMLLIAGLLLLAACQKGAITSYEECVAAGHPSTLSYPAQCTADGKTFTQELSDEEKENLVPPAETEPGPPNPENILREPVPMPEPPGVPDDPMQPQAEVPDSDCSLTTCNGLDNLECGKGPEVCPAIYMIGDACRALANCEIVDGECTLRLDEYFDGCRDCVEACDELDPMAASDCAQDCWYEWGPAGGVVPG